MADMSIKRDPMVMAMGGGAAAATATRTSASAWDSTPNTQNRPVPATRNPSAQPRRPTAQGWTLILYILGNIIFFSFV